MKKLAVIFVTVCMLATVAALPVFAAHDYETNGAAYDEAINDASNLALNKPVHSDTALDQGAGADWTPSKLTDGVLNMNAAGTEYQGFHSIHPSERQNREARVWVDLGEEKAVDTVVIYPAGMTTDTINVTFPNAYAVEVSTDGNNWTRVYEVYDVENIPSGPVTIQFAEVNARYVKLVGMSLNNVNNAGFYMKLSEMAVYNTDYVPAEEEAAPKNILENRPFETSANAAHTDVPYNWGAENLINGNRYDMVTSSANDGRNYGQFAGFHSHVDKPANIDYTITLEEGSTLNQIVIYPSTTKYAFENPGEFHIPANYAFKISDDGETWTTIYETTNGTITEYAPIVIDLDQVYTANYFRFSMMNLPDYVKITELEAYDTTAEPEEDEGEGDDNGDDNNDDSNNDNADDNNNNNDNNDDNNDNNQSEQKPVTGDAGMVMALVALVGSAVGAGALSKKR